MRLRTVGISLRENVTRIDQSALQKNLRAHAGIEDVYFRIDAQYVLFVQYDPRVLSDSALLDRLYREGIHPEPVAPRLRSALSRA